MEAGKTLAMMMMMMAVAVMALMVVVRVADGQAVNCGDVTSNLEPCAAYLTSGGTPPADCCQGVVQLSRIATSRSARQSICQCLENAAREIQPLDAAIRALPSFCGVPFPYSFSSTQDCSRIQ